MPTIKIDDKDYELQQVSVEAKKTQIYSLRLPTKLCDEVLVIPSNTPHRPYLPLQLQLLQMNDAMSCGMFHKQGQ